MEAFKTLNGRSWPWVTVTADASPDSWRASGETPAKSFVSVACRMAFLLLAVMFTATASAINYCDHEMTASGRTIQISMEQPTADNYKITIKSAQEMTGIHAGWWVGTSGGNVQAMNFATLSGDSKTITVNFTSTSAPNLYTQIHVLFPPTTGADLALYPVPPSITWGICSTGGNPPPSFGPFIIPNKTVGDADFEIPQPTTTSSGTISYTSSNPGVATIVGGNMLHIVGGGTTTIRMSQAASASHAAGFVETSFTVAPASVVPAAGPATPPVRNAWDVLSQYGAAYTNQPGVIFDTFGGGASSIADETLSDGSVVKKFNGHSYSGISAATNTLDVSQMTHLHIEVWSPNFTSMRLKLEAHNGAAITARELDVPGGVAQGVWNSFDIPLSSYSSGPAGVDLTKLRWIVPVTFGQNATLYITNIYFYRPATTQPPTLGAFTVPNGTVGGAPITLIPPTSTSSGTWTFSSSNTNVATISGSTLTIVGGGTSTITATQAASGGFGQGVATAVFTASYPAPGPSPVPPVRNEADVFAMFTGTPSVYANDMTAIRADWSNGATTMDEVANGTNTALRVNNMGWLGYVTNGANVDISGMTKLHLDVYLNAPLPSLFVFLLSPPVDHIYTATGLTAGWNSLEIDLSNYSGANLGNIYGLKFESNSSPAPFQMYLDNIYFYRPSGLEPTLADFNIPAQVFGNPPFELSPPSSTSAGAFTYTSSNPSVATISGTTVTMHAPGTATITAHQAADGMYEAGSIATQLIVANPPLGVAAPNPPTRNTWDVISLYSNAYAAHSDLTWQNQATTTDEVLEGNDTKKMTNFQFEIFTFTPANLTGMTTLHLDVYSEDCTGMNIWLLNNGDRMAQFNITPNQWNSIDIPMSTYTAQGLNLNGVFFLKFESRNGGGKTVYVDNVYFYRPETFLPPTIADFSIPAKNFNDPDFEITPPTSNSAGAFTYTSSNTNVATIVNGNMIHIVGGGTSTITATQAADGGYGSGSITAQLVVSFPAPPASPVPPVRTPDRVFSLFTGNPPVYANAINTISALFSSATTTEVANGTNTALQVNNFGLLGLTEQTEARFDVSGMSHLHMDIYLNEPLNANLALSRVNVFLLANGDHLYQASGLTAGWNSISIPLSNFPSADLTQVWGLKLENINAATGVYLDNIYFSNQCYTYFEDADADGYGNPAVSLEDCSGSAPAGYVLDNTDCNDAVGAIHPNAVEIPYNGVDDDCDGAIDETGTVTTSLTSAFCGTTLTSIGSIVGISTVAGHPITGYRIRVTNGEQVQTIETQAPHFNMTMFASYTYATTYTVEIQLQRAGIWQASWGAACLVSTPAILAQGGSGAVNPSQCGITLAQINTLIATTSLPGVTGYRFRISDLTTPTGPNAVQTIERTQNWFSLPMLQRYNYGTLYRIEVSVKTTGGYGGYGSACELSSPAVPSLANCGGSVALKTTPISVGSVAGATQYRFQIVRASDNASSTIDRGVNWFNFNMLPSSTYTIGSLYYVRVAVMTAGTWSPFSDACEITAPAGAGKWVADEQPVAEFKATSYPNPFVSDFSIDVATESQQRVQIRIYDMLGKLVESKEMEADGLNGLRVGANYPSGVYNVIVNQGGVVKTIRVVKR